MSDDIITITRTEELARFCEAAKAAPYVTIDTEFLRERTYYSKLCLIQMALPPASAAKAQGVMTTILLTGSSRGIGAATVRLGPRPYTISRPLVMRQHTQRLVGEHRHEPVRATVAPTVLGSAASAAAGRRPRARPAPRR